MHTPPAAADIHAAVKKTLHSPAFSKFMEQAVQTAIGTIQVESGNVVLRAQPTSGVRFGHSKSFVFYECKSADGTCDVGMQTNLLEEDPDRRSKWYGTESRTDEQGRTWTRSTGYMVQDDFGFLVPVAV